MKLDLFLTILTQLKVHHWQTKSHSEHKALGEAFYTLEKLFDTFIEQVYGIDKIPSTDTTTEVNIKLTYLKSDQDLSAFYLGIRSGLIPKLKQEAGNSGALKNLVDEIEGTINALLYKLQQK